ncbi:hypothetical protein ROJ8625_03744 [Roseivivax jejudonensis]|uniref:Uncharacterized protein n=1 Tax=Roseivivax jejudonensis TaxID=1529041 RepID=A0A1X7A727_9RHOB|nr:hypothetical protein [Roseivivax jejudonensis]SLN71748.1 hypothetical protein ROJ8625_03744 [Roseivivax jejudonensis]
MAAENASSMTLFFDPADAETGRVERAMREADLAFRRIDISTNKLMARAATYLSGSSTFPQLFVGDLNIERCDIEPLAQDGSLAALSGHKTDRIDLAALSSEGLETAVEPINLSDLIPVKDGRDDREPETWPMLQFFSRLFGFWPNMCSPLYRWPQAYKLSFYCQHMPAMAEALELLGHRTTTSVALSASHRYGCRYSLIHAAVAGGERSLETAREFSQSLREGANGTGGPPDLRKSCIDLAARSVTNSVADEHLAAMASVSSDASEANRRVSAVAAIAASFGFLNVFCSLSGVEPEGHWTCQANKHAGFDVGAAAREGPVFPLPDYAPPKGRTPTLDGMLDTYRANVEDAGGVEAYCRRELGIMPRWIGLWPEGGRALHAYFYTEMMQTRTHERIPSELRHLMAHVSAAARDHSYLASFEGWQAWRTGGADTWSLDRLRHAYDASRMRFVPSGLYNARERAALKLAWVSAQIPARAPRRWIQDAAEHFDPEELVQLLTTSAVAGLTQRFCAIARPSTEGMIRSFFKEHGLPSDALSMRYPLDGVMGTSTL